MVLCLLTLNSWHNTVHSLDSNWRHLPVIMTDGTPKRQIRPLKNALATVSLGRLVSVTLLAKVCAYQDR